MKNFSNSKKGLSVLVMVSALSFNLGAMDVPPVPPAGGNGGGVTPQNMATLVRYPEVLKQYSAMLALVDQRQKNAALNDIAENVRDEEATLQAMSFFKRQYYQFPGTCNAAFALITALGAREILTSELFEPALKGILSPGSSFFLKLLKKICSIFRFPFKDGKKDEAEEINEREGALDIKRRGLESDKKLLADMRGMLNKKDADYNEQLEEIKELEKRHKENIKEYFELRKELSKKESEYKVVAVEKQGGSQGKMQISPQQAAALAAAAA